MPPNSTMPVSPTNTAEVERGGHKKCAVLALSRGGCLLGQRLAAALEGDFYACKGHLTETFALAWREYRQMVCIMATGIVVRTLAPLLQDKYHDPAVVVCDERGHYAVSLLSGHLGGANALAQEVAAITGGQAVLTTASDVLGQTPLDLWCRDLGLSAVNKEALTKVMGRLVDRGKLALWSRYPLPELPADLTPAAGRDEADVVIDFHGAAPPATALLVPKALVFGIGCNRGTPVESIARAVHETCVRHNLMPQAIASLASIDLKQDEAGLLAYARQQHLPLVFFTKDQLNQVAGVSTSQAVLQATGAKGVAEPAALLAAGAGSTLLVSKMKWPEVTTAVAAILDPLIPQP